MKWVFPTPEQILEEWKTEYDVQYLWDAGSYSVLDSGTYNQTIQRDLFLENWSKCCEVQTINLADHNLDRWHGTLEEIKSITAHMGKNPDALLTQFSDDNGQLPYVLLQKHLDGHYSTLGGRTRLGVAELTGHEIKALVFDTRKVGLVVVNKIRQHLNDSQKYYFEILSVDELMDLALSNGNLDEVLNKNDFDFFEYHKTSMIFDVIVRVLVRYGFRQKQ